MKLDLLNWLRKLGKPSEIKVSHETEKGKTGRIGEDLACRFLMKRGFSIYMRNYRKKWGEIDVIAKKGTVFHFIEVKTVSCESISFGTPEQYRPEDNVHAWKLQRLGRTIQTFMSEKGLHDATFHFHIVTVLLDLETKKAKIDIFEEIIQ